MAVAAYATKCRDAFEAGLFIGRCGVACLSRREGDDLTWLSALRRRMPHAPAVVVTPLSPVAVAVMRTLPAVAPPVVWAEEVAVNLAPAMREEAARDAVQRLVTSVAAGLPMTPLVHSALRRLVHAQPPSAACAFFQRCWRCPGGRFTPTGPWPSVGG